MSLAIKQLINWPTSVTDVVSKVDPKFRYYLSNSSISSDPKSLDNADFKKICCIKVTPMDYGVEITDVPSGLVTNLEDKDLKDVVPNLPEVDLNPVKEYIDKISSLIESETGSAVIVYQSK